jgi:hypothetical protein
MMTNWSQCKSQRKHVTGYLYKGPEAGAGLVGMNGREKSMPEWKKLYVFQEVDRQLGAGGSHL